MTRLQWIPVPGDYEIGCDRGVIKTEPSGFTFPWNGLLSVTESFDGGERESNYFDGRKISDSVPSRNWKATVRALTYPEDLSSVLGYRQLRSGVYLTRQRRSEFYFSYRTLKGDGSYKLHLVYNATVVANEPGRKTDSDVPDPDVYEWNITAVPWRGTLVNMPRRKPTAHYVVDSSEVTVAKMTALENLVYGDPALSTGPSFPSPELVYSTIR